MVKKILEWLLSLKFCLLENWTINFHISVLQLYNLTRTSIFKYILANTLLQDASGFTKCHVCWKTAGNQWPPKMCCKKKQNKTRKFSGKIFSSFHLKQWNTYFTSLNNQIYWIVWLYLPAKNVTSYPLYINDSIIAWKTLNIGQLNLSKIVMMIMIMA